MIRREDRAINADHVQRFLDTWYILEPEAREKFLDAHQARSTEVKEVSQKLRDSAGFRIDGSVAREGISKLASVRQGDRAAKT